MECKNIDQLASFIRKMGYNIRNCLGFNCDNSLIETYDSREDGLCDSCRQFAFSISKKVYEAIDVKNNGDSDITNPNPLDSAKASWKIQEDAVAAIKHKCVYELIYNYLERKNS